MIENPANTVPSPRLRRFARLIAWFVGGGLIGLLAVAVALRFSNKDGAIPPLQTADWQAARDRWSSSMVGSYEIEIEVTGRQPATYSVEVQNNQVVRAARNGNLLPQQRTWSTWTVEGMFETIARDLESVERHESGRAEASTPRLQLRASFDAQLGYPNRYLRTEMVRLGSNPEVSWKVVRFVRH